LKAEMKLYIKVQHDAFLTASNKDIPRNRLDQELSTDNVKWNHEPGLWWLSRILTAHKMKILLCASQITQNIYNAFSIRNRLNQAWFI